MREERKRRNRWLGAGGMLFNEGWTGVAGTQREMDGECVGAQTRGREARAVGGLYGGTHTLFVSARCAENSNI